MLRGEKVEVIKYSTVENTFVVFKFILNSRLKPFIQHLFSNKTWINQRKIIFKHTHTHAPTLMSFILDLIRSPIHILC